MELYLRISLPLEQVADRIAALALPGYELELRDGLNLGGGDYFEFRKDGTEILLVCNDADHAEVFVESRNSFPYYCYVWEGADDMLNQMHSSLSKHGIECEIGDET